jgi:hypothetical protein
MQKKPLIGLTLAVVLITLAIIGCSAVTPNPEIIIIGVNPPGGIDSTAGTTVIFRNMNKVDAIITRRVLTYTDTLVGTAPLSLKYNVSAYVPAETDSVLYTFFPSPVPMGGAASGRSFSVEFSGTDAYGYNKTFTVSTSKIWY